MRAYVYTHMHTPISRERSRPSLWLLPAIPGDARDSPRGLNTPRMHHVPRRCRRRCFMRPFLPHRSFAAITPPSFPFRQRGLRRLRLRTYAEQISLDELPANTPAPSWSNSIQFRRLSSPPLPPAFFFLVSLSPDLHDPVSPRRTIDPRLTLLGAVSLNSIYGFPLFSFFSASAFFFCLLEKGSIIVDLSMIIWNILVRGWSYIASREVF